MVNISETPLRYYDTHCHLDHTQFAADQTAVLARMRDAGVIANAVGFDRATSQAVCDIARTHEQVYAVVGQHPVDNRTEMFEAAVYRRLIADANVVAVGECGLDYYRIEADDASEKQRQREVFEAQIAFACEAQVPLMLHCRPAAGTMDAYEEVLDILEYTHRNASLPGGTAHFFVGTPDIARRFFDIGFHISFSGIVTFAREFDEVIQMAPADRLLVETDAPFAAPQPYRGKRNEPLYISYTVANLAEIRGDDPEHMRARLLANGCALFHNAADR